MLPEIVGGYRFRGSETQHTIQELHRYPYLGQKYILPWNPAYPPFKSICSGIPYLEITTEMLIHPSERPQKVCTLHKGRYELV
jgi:hypothetical protein